MVCIKKLNSAIFSILLTLFIAGCSPPIESQPLEENNIDDVEKTELVDNLEETPTVEDTEERLSFYGVGDNLIHSGIFNYAQTDENSYDFKPIYQNITEDVQAADLAYINQESIIGGDEFGFSGYPAFNTPSDMVKDLVDIGFDIVGGSNNHSLDKGTAGVENTLRYWNEYEDDILFTGVFDSQESRDTADIIEVEGVKFAILTYTYGTNGIQPEYPYLVNYFDSDLITKDVQKAKDESDFVIVSAHWGDEHALAPNEMQTEYAQLFADLEVDVVVGTHSHTIQPVEWVTGVNGNETLVIYSLGNLVAASVSDINMLGGSIQFDFVKDEDETYIENVLFVPLVIHYEAAIAGDIRSRTDFEVIKLPEYSEEVANKHALNNFENNIVSPIRYNEIVQEVIDAEFLE